ncbi:MAG: hypothetical protein H6510_07650 [Acidobacteria bacterium]|nr:hypothetical protein [Acidobacteriota bacterium]
MSPTEVLIIATGLIGVYQDGEGFWLLFPKTPPKVKIHEPKIFVEDWTDLNKDLIFESTAWDLGDFPEQDDCPKPGSLYPPEYLLKMSDMLDNASDYELNQKLFYDDWGELLTARIHILKAKMYTFLIPNKDKTPSYFVFEKSQTEIKGPYFSAEVAVFSVKLEKLPSGLGSKIPGIILITNYPTDHAEPTTKDAMHENALFDLYINSSGVPPQLANRYMAKRATHNLSCDPKLDKYGQAVLSFLDAHGVFGERLACPIYELP